MENISLEELEEKLNYRSQWKLNRKDYVAITDVVWVDDDYLVACTNKGRVAVFHPPPVGMDDNDMYDNFSPGPLWTQKLSQGALYSCSINRLQGSLLLLITGEEGVLVLDWEKQLVPIISQGGKKSSNLIDPLVRLRTHVSANPAPIRQVLVYQNTLIGAVDDSFGAYQWDFETQKIISCFGDGHLSTMHLSGDILLTGSFKGILGLHDCRKHRPIDRIELQTAIANETTSQRQHPLSECSVSCCASDSDFVFLGGGREGDHGWLATWHLPMRAWVGATLTHARPRALCTAGSKVISVSNDCYTRHWDWMNWNVTRELRSERPTSGALAMRNGRAATAGLGAEIDILEDGSLRSWQLTL